MFAELLPRLRRDEMPDPEAMRRDILAEQARTSSAPPPRIVRACQVTRRPGTAFPVYELQPAGSKPRRSVLYLHGGGYAYHADRSHWRYAVKLARELDARIVVPEYPLAPGSTWRDTHPALLELFPQLAIESPQGVVVAGDSAGGGLALALAQHIRARSGPQPTHVLLVSPWVDLVDETPGAPRAGSHDSPARRERLRLWAQWWSGGGDLRRPELSPSYGDLAGLPPALMFCGTADTFVTQCRDLAERAGRAGWAMTYVEEPNLVHNFPLRWVGEARPAWRTTVEFLSGGRRS